ncbi:PDR/VanB family oxidoreductase [Cupriavidus basilensis]
MFAFSSEGFPARFEVGSHIDVWCGDDSRGHVRSYSLIGSRLQDNSFLIAVRKVSNSRGGSSFMWNLESGHTLQVSGPLNEFPLTDRKVPKLLIAGGIGITPLVGMAEELDADNADFRMIYAGRSRESMPFLKELGERLGERLTIYDESDGQTPDIPATIGSQRRDAELYVCGPIGMLNAARTAWEHDRRAVTDLHFETFANSGSLPTTAFQVSIPRLKIDLNVGSDQSLLEVLEAVGVDPLYGCRKGECGLCAVEVLDLDGAIDHRDIFFSDEQKSQGRKLCACVSRISGRSVTIDLP